MNQVCGPVFCPVLIIDADQEMYRARSFPYHCLYFVVVMMVDMFMCKE